MTNLSTQLESSPAHYSQRKPARSDKEPKSKNNNGKYIFKIFLTIKYHFIGKISEVQKASECLTQGHKTS